ncbi:MAG: hypothetical protein U1E18_02145 [Brevundimonas sp.]|uniref:hypothetical protein n=1 Tax=Brevundimonas sp. TaxID=1871086 RepID=UPI00274553DE|nr:hypothetical protein [Brevundimonas sp.]MDP3370988.1 hypothetical protein [Brevundimonas sp.]MDZ4108386.1 hypothetical protein [Brevundimonas sp.]
MTTRTPLGLIGGVALIAAAITGFALSDAPAHAQVAAKVESQTRPNFGVLLDPPTRSSRGRTHRRWDYRTHRPDWRPGSYRPGGEEVVLVDCGGNPGTGAVEDAVRRVRPGGTLVVRARGGPCVGWLNIDKPMTIIGESRIDLRDWDRGIPPTLQAPDGLPCVTVAPGVRVEIRDMIFSSPRGGAAACVFGIDAEIVMSAVGFRHAGDEAAIYADGGLIDIRGSRIDAQTQTAAIVAERAVLTADDLIIGGSRTGIEIVPGAPRASHIARTRLWGPNSRERTGPKSIGLMVGGGREFGQVQVVRSTLCGYDDGVSVEGAGVSVTRSRICMVDTGIAVYSGSIALSESRITRAETGVLVGLGSGSVIGNVFAGVHDIIDGRGNLTVSNNKVWSRSPELCRPTMVQRYRDRYSPSWPEDPRRGYHCEISEYPRAWWRQDEGAFGLAYEDYAYRPDQHDRYRDGWGWYDCEGRYVVDNRWRGDDRWNRGGWGRDRTCRQRSNGPGIRLFPDVSVYVDAGLDIGW